MKHVKVISNGTAANVPRQPAQATATSARLQLNAQNALPLGLQMEMGVVFAPETHLSVNLSAYHAILRATAVKLLRLIAFYVQQETTLPRKRPHLGFAMICALLTVMIAQAPTTALIVTKTLLMMEMVAAAVLATASSMELSVCRVPLLVMAAMVRTPHVLNALLTTCGLTTEMNAAVLAPIAQAA